MGKHKSPSRIPPSIAAKIRAQSTSPDPPPRSSPGSDETVPQSKVPANVTASAPPTTSQGHVEPPQEGSVVGTPEVDASASNSKPSSVLPLDTEVNSTAKTSWRDKVKGSPSRLSKKGTPFQLESGEWCITIPNAIVEKNLKKWDSFIVGQFNGNMPSHGALHAILNGIWSFKNRDITVSKLGPKIVLIKVPCPATRCRVLLQGIWNIEGQTMFVTDYSPRVSPTMPELVEAPVWLELRGVPPHFFNEESLERIAGLVGDPLYLHPTTANMTNLEVAKVFTVVSLTEPLPEAVNAQFESGEVVRVGVSCPWLPPTCSFCKETGHTIRRCPSAPITCENCKSTSHVTDLCPRGKKSVVPDNSTSDKELTTAQQKRKQKKKEARQRKKAKLAAAKLAATTKDSPRTAKDYLTDPSAS